MEIEDNASNMWMVRAGEGGRLFDDFKDNSVVAISWKSVGDLSKVQSKNEVRQIVDRVYHDEKLGSRIVTSSQIARFRFDFKEGDNVITYDPASINMIRHERSIFTSERSNGSEPFRETNYLRPPGTRWEPQQPHSIQGGKLKLRFSASCRWENPSD
jgi:hypothetical protein